MCPRSSVVRNWRVKSLQAAVFVFTAWVGQAATFYVSPSGLDIAPGISPLTAWRTIQKADSVTQPGDIVRILPGTYKERVTLKTDGTAAKPITYLADGPVKVQGGFYLNGSDYTKVIGFEITHENNPTEFNYSGILVLGANGSQILNCHIHHVDGLGIEIISSKSTLVRGCDIHHMAPQIYPESNVGIVVRAAPSTDVTIEYNRISYVSDFINTASSSPSGSTNTVIRNNRLGPSATNILAHVDGVQQNGPSPDGLYEANYFIDNDSHDNHFYLNQVPEASRWIIRGNVCVRSVGFLDWSGASRQSFYHNTFVNNFDYYESHFQVYVHENSTRNVARNNIWSRSTHPEFGTVYHVEPDSDLDQDYDLSFQNGAFSQPNGIQADPLFADASASDYTLSLFSPAVNNAGAITQATSNETNSLSLRVTNASVFWPGDNITIGDEAPVGISAINLALDIITLAAPRSWSTNAGVFWEGRKDIGAYPLKLSGFDYSMSLPTQNGAFVASASSTITPNINDPSLIRMVEFSVDGIPMETVTTSPFTFRWNTAALSGAHVVRAIAYPRYASDVVSRASEVNVTITKENLFPKLETIRVSGILTLRWPAQHPLYTLQTADSPAGPWSNLEGAINLELGFWTHHVTAPGPTRFYRLNPTLN